MSNNNPTLSRLDTALKVQTHVNAQFVYDTAKADTLLHCAELILKDDFDFEFAHSCLSEVDYCFLHMLTSAVSSKEEINKRRPNRLTFPQFMRVLQAAIVTLHSVDTQFEADPEKYDPFKDQLSQLPRKDLKTKIEVRSFDMLPVILLCIFNSPQYEKECQGDTWRQDVLNKSLSFMSLTHSLLLKRGLGDRE